MGGGRPRPVPIDPEAPALPAVRRREPGRSAALLHWPCWAPSIAGASSGVWTSAAAGLGCSKSASGRASRSSTCTRCTGRFTGLDRPRTPARSRERFRRAGCRPTSGTAGCRRCPTPTASSTRCFSISILEHLRPDEQDAAFREIRRVLRPGGQVVYGVPIERRLMVFMFRLMVTTSGSTTSRRNDTWPRPPSGRCTGAAPPDDDVAGAGLRDRALRQAVVVAHT